MEKLKLHSPNLVEQNIDKIAALFPGCLTEARDESGNVKRAIDFDLLRQELSDSIVEGPRERYHLDWPGKKEALLAANAPIAKTLRPCREESVNFDTTKNLFIEGDNLEALKLLQETYLGTVKMIYIDPPYNTGNDFIYNDKFASDTDEYLVRSKQADELGERLVLNTDSNGRFHSDWLSMLYPRLKLARNLLHEDGVIFIAIDENEIDNVRKLADEVFGRDSFLFQVTMLCNPKGRSQDKYVANCHEYLVAFAKRELPKGATTVPRESDEVRSDFPLTDARGPYRELELRNTHREFGKHNRPNLYYPFFVDTNNSVYLENGPNRKEVYPIWPDGFEGCWTWSLERAELKLSEVVAKRVNNVIKIFRKNYAYGEDGDSRKMVKSLWLDGEFTTEKGQEAFNALFPETKEKIFQSPKSVSTLERCLEMVNDREMICLDFFAGSGTTGHAVISLNSHDGGMRRFILVQVPQECDVESAAYKHGLKTISEIAKERVRRAGAQIGSSFALGTDKMDIGFRVLKIDSSNMKDIYYSPDAERRGDLLDRIENIKEDRTGEDLLFQVMLDWGVDLASKIERQEIDGKTVYFVDENAIAACFDRGVTETTVKQIAARAPLRAVFRDNSYDSDAAKINVEQIFKALSPTTEVKGI